MTEPPFTADTLSHKRRLTQRLCRFATLFFLLKGLAWLSVPVLVAWFGRG